jgi:hypothetical protein
LGGGSSYLDKSKKFSPLLTKAPKNASKKLNFSAKRKITDETPVTITLDITNSKRAIPERDSKRSLKLVKSLKMAPEISKKTKNTKILEHQLKESKVLHFDHY